MGFAFAFAREALLSKETADRHREFLATWRWRRPLVQLPTSAIPCSWLHVQISNSLAEDGGEELTENDRPLRDLREHEVEQLGLHLMREAAAFALTVIRGPLRVLQPWRPRGRVPAARAIKQLLRIR